jgi:hypothetical protein
MLPAIKTYSYSEARLYADEKNFKAFEIWGPKINPTQVYISLANVAISSVDASAAKESKRY